MEQFDIRTFCMRLLKNWYWFIIAGIFCTLVAVWHYLSTTTRFRVDSTLMIRSSDDEHSIPQAEMLSMMGLGGMKQIDDEIAILTSNDILMQAIRELDLQTEYRKRDKMRWVGQYPAHDLTLLHAPLMTDTLTKSIKVSVKVRKNDILVKVKYGFFTSSRHKLKTIDEPFISCVGPLQLVANVPLEKGDKYKIRTAPLLPLAAAYKERIKAAKLKSESNIITLTAQTDMPEREVRFINKQIELYNMDAVIDKNIMASNTAAFIEDRLKLIAVELSEAEEQVEQYKQDKQLLSPSAEAQLWFAESNSYRRQLAELNTQMNLIQYVEDFIRQQDNNDALIPANLGIADHSLAGVIGEYNALVLHKLRIRRTATADNPILAQLDSQIELMRSTILSSIQSARNSLNISVRDLQSRNQIAQGQMQETPGIEREFVAIRRDKNLKEQLYLYLYQKREENALTLASTVMPAKIVDIPKVYPKPLNHRPIVILFLIALFSLALPIGGMYLYDLFNTKIDDEKLFEKHIRIPYAGALIQNHHGGHFAVQEGVNSVSAELFRGLRTNLRFLQPQGVEHPAILVTSGINSEGKSYVATNLAMSLALIKKKVVLVGLDIRKPQLAAYFGLSNPGCLTSYLADDSYSIDDTIMPSGKHPNLDIIPAGIIPPNPSELMLSNRLDELIAELKKRYDYVIIDSAPIALVSDTFMLDRISDMTLYVSRFQYTTKELVDFLNQIAEQKRLKNMAAVLNGVKRARVGYGY